MENILEVKSCTFENILDLLRGQELVEVLQAHQLPVRGVLGEVCSEHRRGEDEVLEHAAEVVEVEVAGLLGVVVVELLLEAAAGDLAVDLLHELLELGQGDDALLARSLHLVETLAEPSLQGQAVGRGRDVLNIRQIYSLSNLSWQ